VRRGEERRGEEGDKEHVIEVEREREREEGNRCYD
jgi:hypothetical protein